jgi:hypothetical protein
MHEGDTLAEREQAGRRLANITYQQALQQYYELESITIYGHITLDSTPSPGSAAVRGGV